MSFITASFKKEQAIPNFILGQRKAFEELIIMIYIILTKMPVYKGIREKLSLKIPSSLNGKFINKY